MPESPAILCDIGNVIVTFDFSIAAARLAARSPHPQETVLDQLHHLKLPFEDGQIDDTTFVTEAIKTLGFEGSPETFRFIWNDIFAPNDAMIATLERLATTLPLHLLSNTSGLHKDYLFATYPIFARFQNGIYSYSARASKPGRRIFEIAVEQLHLDPSQTFYIDDLDANIVTARQLGFVTHHYHHQKHPELVSALDQWLSLTTPSPEKNPGIAS